MDRDQVNNVAHSPASGRRHRLVHGEVNRVQDVAEHLVSHGGEEAEVAVGNPFEARRGSVTAYFGAVNCRLPSQPADDEASAFQGSRIGVSDRCNSFLAVMKNVDVAGVPQRTPV